jgi:DNA-binding transcriptional LysR family regulator/DNA-binding CsgD family transcriptional regulator
MNQAQTEAVPRPTAAAAGAPQGVELRHLRYFAAVADAGTITRAAERLFVAQPTLSQQIHRLEQIVGTPLLHRRRGGVQLTAAGTVLLTAARDVLAAAGHAVSQTRTDSHDLLVGRQDERGQIDRLLEAAGDGLSAVLVLHGEPGIGKTALLDWAIESARGFRTVRLVGIESETELGFAALHQLLLPFLGRLDLVPGPQRHALATALGLRDGSPPDRFLVGLASLTLLAAAAAERPLLCVVDDVQWLDQESAAVLAFVARRLSVDAIAMLFAVQEPSERHVRLQGLPQLRVRGLPATDARQLLASAAPSKVDSGVSDQIIAQTSGNPLALIELGREFSAEQLAGQAALPEPLPVGPSLEARFLRQVRCLPDATQTLLLTAAADPAGDPAVLWRAGECLGFGITAAAPAESQKLVTFGPQVRFRHPLIRSAVYHGAALMERKRVHAALAEATDPSTGADLRAWHRAEAAIGPDESVAAELEQAAERARSRGGWAATGAFLTRAAMLTPDAAPHVRRVLAAAAAEATAGASLHAQALLDGVADQLDDPRQRIVAQRIEGAIHYALDQTGQTASILLNAARQLVPLDIGQARAALLDALTAARISGRLAVSGVDDTDVARAARSTPLPPQSAVTVGDLLLDADATLLLDGPSAAAPLLRQAVTALLAAPLNSADMLSWTEVGCRAAGALGDDDALHALASRLEQQAREQGAVLPLSVALVFSGVSELFAGALSQAWACFTERGAIEVARGGNCEVGQALVLAWRGQVSEALTQAAAAERVACEQGQGWKLSWLEYARSVLELGTGHYAAALAAVPRAYEENPLLSAFALPDLIEAAVRCGQRAFAERAVERVARHAAPSPTPLALGLLARSRALLADGSDAETLYQEAITHLRQARGSGHLARAHLLYGEWLRRARRRRDAREHLRTAHGMFEEMGAGAFAQRASLGVVATGGTARRCAPVHSSGLTPQELQVATLAAAGSTNPEIAAQLFISPKTVDYHLGKVFRKLGVSSRRELARIALPRA